MELREALSQISQIRRHMVRTEIFRGYRPLTVGFSGVLALIAATAQGLWMPKPIEHVGSYLLLWIGVAAISCSVTGGEVWWHSRAARSATSRRLTRLTIEQFLPCLVAGALLTAILVQRMPTTVWMLPGLWAMLFSLGVFASYRWLPAATFWVGVYYLLAGTMLMAGGPSDSTLSPWSMGLTFGGGQLLAATILHFSAAREEREYAA